MLKELVVLSLFVFLLSTVESNKPIKKVLSIVKDIKNEMVTVDEIVDALAPIIEESCSCCDEKPQSQDCPDGWDYFDHTKSCYKRFSNSSLVSWMNAQYTCRQHGGNLAKIHDEETNTYVNGIAGGLNAWVGLIRIGPLVNPKPLNSQWAWIDGSPLDYSNWVSGQPDNNNGDEFCGQINRSGNSGIWNDVTCNDTTISEAENFICERKEYSPHLECPDGWTYFDQTNRCYRLFIEPGITWMEAQCNCTKFGGDLAMIFDEQTNDEVYSLSGGSIAFVGAHRVGPLGPQLTWIDGSALDFSNWSGGQPDNYNGGEFCVVMNRFGPTTWNDQPCDSKNDNYICQI